MNKITRGMLASMCAGYTLLCSQAATAVAPASLSQVPLFLVTSADAQVMLNLSNDHQLFYKAYDDWSDVSGDGIIDITYDHTIDYYGYFDAYKCYDYDNNRFEPQAVTTDKYCNGVSGSWSGNFLNWASMTRIDTVRKILFGGARVVDTDTQTVLERAYLPGDAHSFAKYYSSASGEIGKLTPWNVAEITLCNTTYAADGNSESITAPPLIRVAEGNFALWAANERYQCHWQNNGELESNIFNSPNPGTNNGNDPATTGLNAEADNPDWTADRLGSGDYVVRVEACVDGLIGEEKCKVYPAGNRKPIGLLQEFGDDGAILFGMMTGSFQNNKSGGTLRKNVSVLTDEINTTTDGTFKAPPVTGNIIGNLTALRVSGYDHDPGYYNSADNCSWGLSSFPDGRCTNWGNPQSEIFLESLRYFAGESADFNANDAAYINNLISASTWDDPLGPANYCAPLNVIQVNASVTSYDDDDLGGATDLASLTSLDTWTNAVGTGESIAGNRFFVGEGSAATTTDGLCTSKTLTNLSDAEGLCPEAPRLEGGFGIAGLAYYARTESIRDDIDDINGNTADINVKTYGVTLSPAVPKIEVPVPNSDDVVTILPACRNQSIGGNCAIVDFKVVERHQETSPGSGVFTGRFYVNWEDSEQGGDYDQDMAGILRYSINATSITVTTNVFADSTPNQMGFGYIISGTTQDGFHTHSGINFFTAYNDPTGVASCSDAAIECETGRPATSVAYTLGDSSGDLLEDPLWYAAKWGGFEEDDLTVSQGGERPDAAAAPNDIPDQTYEWDSNGDGLPDNYFYSTNPFELEDSLSAVFLDVTRRQSSASSTAANSQRVSTDTTIYQARFDSTSWTGELLAYPVIPATGLLESYPTWDAGYKLETVAWNARTIITHEPTTGGVPFEWASLNATQQALLNTDPDTLAADTLGEGRVEYLRGNEDLELQEGGAFRDRIRKLGDLVNSSPAYVGAPNFAYPDWLERFEDSSNPRSLTNGAAESYGDFIVRMAALGSGAGREPMLYVGANDGMLHGFTANPDIVLGGIEKLAFVPNEVYTTLGQLTSPDYTHRYYVDGSPTAADVMFSDNRWHTMVAGGLNGGGRGIYALDVTDPTSFSEANAANIFLWEIGATGDFADLGFTYSRPAIVKNHSGTNAYTYESGEGKWITVFGNGYASAAGKAVLYIVDAETGNYIDHVVVDDTGNNGLSTVSPVDVDGDFKIDIIYAGDLKGNVWKFIPDGTLNGWKADFSGSPLFTGPADPTATLTNTQPITMRIEAGRHPTGLPGVMVYFGTGSYFQVGDNVGDANTHSVYGIWDLWNNCTYDAGGRRASCASDYSVNDGGMTLTAPTTPNITRANLLQQCVTNTDGSSCLPKRTVPGLAAVATGTLNNYDVRLVSDNAYSAWDWAAARGQMGWYLDLPDYGEKQVTRHTLRGGRLIFVSVIPSTHACEDGGGSWLMELDAATGGRLNETVFDLDGDGFFSLNDDFTTGGGSSKIAVSGKKSKEGITQPPSIVRSADGSKEFKYASGSKGGVEVTVESPGAFARGRKSWVRLQ
ncbi:MAG: PilC/PilY family type IV pilus protein [Sedimenticolaceae bacterium]